MGSTIGALPQGTYSTIGNKNVIDVEHGATYECRFLATEINRDDQVSLSEEADYNWRALTVAYATGNFLVRFCDSDGYFLSNALVPSQFIMGTVASPADPASPFSLFPGITIPAGGRITVELQSANDTPNNQVQLLFRGVQRLRLNRQQQTRIVKDQATERDRYVDMPFWYYYQLPTLNGNQTRFNLGLETERDADFVYRSIQYISTGSFDFQFYAPDGRQHSNGLVVPCTTLNGIPSLPKLVYPEETLPAGNNIIMDVADTSGQSNTIQLLFKGVKRFLLEPTV